MMEKRVLFEASTPSQTTIEMPTPILCAIYSESVWPRLRWLCTRQPPNQLSNYITS